MDGHGTSRGRSQPTTQGACRATGRQEAMRRPTVRSGQRSSSLPNALTCRSSRAVRAVRARRRTRARPSGLGSGRPREADDLLSRRPPRRPTGQPGPDRRPTLGAAGARRDDDPRSVDSQQPRTSALDGRTGGTSGTGTGTGTGTPISRTAPRLGRPVPKIADLSTESPHRRGGRHGDAPSAGRQRGLARSAARRRGIAPPAARWHRIAPSAENPARRRRATRVLPHQPRLGERGPRSEGHCSTTNAASRST